MTSINLYAQCTDPEPYISPEQDTVCGNVHHISVENVQGTGVWTFFVNGEPIIPSPPVYPDPTSPDITITIASYPGNSIEIECVWTETIDEGGDICIGTASQTVLFAKSPTASVGPYNIVEICGNVFQTDAHIVEEFGSGKWLSSNPYITFDNQYIPDATVEVISNQIFGDSAYAYFPLVWEMTNYACTSHDTLHVYAYQKPSPFAGLYDTVCGNTILPEQNSAFRKVRNIHLRVRGVFTPIPIPQQQQILVLQIPIL